MILYINSLSLKWAANLRTGQLRCKGSLQHRCWRLGLASWATVPLVPKEKQKEMKETLRLSPKA